MPIEQQIIFKINMTPKVDVGLRPIVDQLEQLIREYLQTKGLENEMTVDWYSKYEYPASYKK